ncbi:MAG TPA: hypothetical protein VJW94_02290 [Candidatus Acidoferrum sp.]|nr:hypothetical protein [Candidatus Acidoferrum sp.]
MFAKFSSVFAAAAILTAAFFGARTAQAQDASPGLADQLKSQYKIAKVGMDSTGWSVTEPGTVLVIQKGGILGVPPANLAIATATFKDGELHGPNGVTVAMVAKVSRQLTIGEKVYIFKMDLNAKSDKISLFIIECDACNNAQQPAAYKALLVFQFPKGYLDKADASQVQDVISQVLAPDSSSGSNDQQQAPQQQQPAQSQQPATSQPDSAPTTVQIGQSIDQVKAVLGTPEKVFDVGKKQIFVYKDVKITFVDGKVSDVQ